MKAATVRAELVQAEAGCRASEERRYWKFHGPDIRVYLMDCSQFCVLAGVDPWSYSIHGSIESSCVVRLLSDLLCKISITGRSAGISKSVLSFVLFLRLKRTAFYLEIEPDNEHSKFIVKFELIHLDNQVLFSRWWQPRL